MPSRDYEKRHPVWYRCSKFLTTSQGPKIWPGTPPSKTSSQNTLFLLFSTLPIELQIKIWLLFIQEPSSKPHSQHSRLYTRRNHPCAHSSIGWTRCFTISPALQVCRLSRELACKYYLSLEKVGRHIYLEHEQREIDHYFNKYGNQLVRTRSATPRASRDVVSFLIFDYTHWKSWQIGWRHSLCTAGDDRECSKILRTWEDP